MADAFITTEENLANLPSYSSECCIFQVREELRRVNHSAYEPQTLAIGPYHHQKSGLQSMEIHKLYYLKSLLNRTKEKSTTKYFESFKFLEEKARKCYAEPLNLTSNEFLKMLVLDAIFILEFLRKTCYTYLRDENDPIFNIPWIHNAIFRDLRLFENQIPFFILVELFNMTNLQHQTRQQLIKMAVTLGYLYISPDIDINYISQQNYDFKHLLDLLHYCSLSSFTRSSDYICLDNCKFIHSVTELKEAGIKFRKIEKNFILNLGFEKGIMEIPQLTIQDGTESFLRNLIAHEQYCMDANGRIFTDYANVMDNLISAPKDVEILRRLGIIQNLVGDDEVISAMFNSLGTGTILGNPFYLKMFEMVNLHCGKLRNVWMAKLRRNYFSSPWLLISLIAAIFFLFFTMFQTIFTVMACFKN